MQAHGAFRVIHVPKLHVLEICPVWAIKHMSNHLKSKQSDPLFLLLANGHKY